MKPEIQKEDLEIALPIINTINPKVIVDIGTYLGGSACLWRDTFTPDILITIDIMQRIPGMEGVEFLLGNSKDAETVGRATSLLKGRKIDFLFIDGDHAYEGVKRDFELYSPMVRDRGIIMFHDVIYHTDVDDVPSFWKEVKRNYDYIEIAQNFNTTGIGLITKATPYTRSGYGNTI